MVRPSNEVTLWQKLRWGRAFFAVPIAAALVSVGPSSVRGQDAPKCYAAVGLETRGLGKAAALGQEKCHQLAQKVGVPGGLCNNIEGFPFTIINGGKYQQAEQKALAKLHGPTGKCPQPAAAAATDMLPGDSTSNKLPSLRSIVSERADRLLGNAVLGNDPAKLKCFKVISSARRAIADKMMNTAIQCQKTQSPGSPLSNACLNDAPLLSFINGRKTAIQAACTGLTGAQVGSCDPLPDCVAEAALAEGKSLATIAYPGENCTKGTPSPNARTVNVNLQTPVPLGGVTVLVRYPRFDAGVDENGSNIDIAGRFTYSAAFLDAFDLDDALRISALDSSGISSGLLASVKFDVCRPAYPVGLCSVTTTQACSSANDCRAPACPTCAPQNKCTGDGVTSCTSDAQCVGNGTCGEKCIAQGRSCSVSQWINCSTDADCPATESCLSQFALTTCEVESASDPSGNPVDGVSCSVTITEP